MRSGYQVIGCWSGNWHTSNLLKIKVLDKLRVGLKE